jgi:septum formation inhibitor-activating ATPase MinD
MKLERILAHAGVVLVCVVICAMGAVLGLRETPLVLFGVVTITIGYTVLDVVHHDGPVDGALVRSKITSNLVFVSIAALVMTFVVGPIDDRPAAPGNDARPAKEVRR